MFELLLIVGIIMYVYYKNGKFDDIKKMKYNQAKKAYSQDGKNFDKITSLNDSKPKKAEIVQNDAIKYSTEDNYDEPIREYKSIFRKRPNSDL